VTNIARLIKLGISVPATQQCLGKNRKKVSHFVTCNEDLSASCTCSLLSVAAEWIYSYLPSLDWQLLTAGRAEESICAEERILSWEASLVRRKQFWYEKQVLRWGKNFELRSKSCAEGRILSWEASLALRKEFWAEKQVLCGGKNCELRREFWCKIMKVKGDWRKLHNEERHDLCSLTNVI
jgi:hypothetical protein